MQRITVSLPDDVVALLKDDARRLRRPVSDIVREAVEKELGVHPDCELPKSLLPVLGSSGIADLAENMNAYLEESWPEHLRRKMNDR